MGKIQKAILLALYEAEDHTLYFRNLCEATKPPGVKYGTHKTAVSRAVWALAEGDYGQGEGAVRVWSLLWTDVRSRNQPEEISDAMFAVPLGKRPIFCAHWYGGRGPIIKKVELTEAGRNLAETELEK
jgi:hypothetical protein